MGKTLTDDPYQALGVSSSKEGVRDATETFDKGLYPGAFCIITPVSRQYPEWVRDRFAEVIHADGVGTKSNVAYLALVEGIGDHFLTTIAQNAIVMNIDDMACVGVVNNIAISNLVARNANRINDEALAKILMGYPQFFKKMENLGIDLYLCGGETADVGSYTTTLGIDVFAKAVIAKEKVIDSSKITPGEIIVGLASDGFCTYEEEENSGIRSNGLTLAINTLLSPYYRKYTEVMDGTIPMERLFCGHYCLEDNLPGSTLTIGEALLSPTRTYLPVIRDILAAKIPVSGIIHCSGGGLTKSKNFGKGITYVKDDVLNLHVPPIFKTIQESGNIDWYYMYKTFNMGIGMEVIVKTPRGAEMVIRCANKYGIDAYVIGYTEASGDGVNKVKIGDFVYAK